MTSEASPLKYGWAVGMTSKSKDENPLAAQLPERWEGAGGKKCDVTKVICESEALENMRNWEKEIILKIYTSVCDLWARLCGNFEKYRDGVIHMKLCLPSGVCLVQIVVIRKTFRLPSHAQLCTFKQGYICSTAPLNPLKDLWAHQPCSRSEEGRVFRCNGIE